MDTSDSEYFESADEDVEQDSNNVNKVKKTVSVKPPTADAIETQTLEKLADIAITTKEEEIGTKTQSTAEEEKPVNVEKSKEKLEPAEVKPVPVEPANVEERDNLWDDSELDWGKEAEWESVERVEENVETEPSRPVDTPSSTWGSWGSWNVSSIISTATSSVSTLTQNISTALETGIGVPDPEELAKIDSEISKEINEEPSSGGFPFGNIVMGVSHLTKLVESTGTKVISGGLDTLESIGKKTMQVLQEGDPGLKKKRAFLKIEQDKPVLSQVFMIFNNNSFIIVTRKGSAISLYQL